ncbi:MAG: hypothetical protein ACKPKO_06510, partial [Candidatus Fonsibacter sp.]
WTFIQKPHFFVPQPRHEEETSWKTSDISAQKAAGEHMEPWEQQHDFQLPDEERASRAKEYFVPAYSKASADAVIVDGVIDQNTSIDAVHKIKAVADQRRVDIWERLFGRQTIVKIPSTADVRLIEQRMANPKDEDYCMACNKHGLKWGGRKYSKDHQKMLQWHVSCDGQDTRPQAVLQRFHPATEQYIGRTRPQ